MVKSQGKSKLKDGLFVFLLVLFFVLDRFFKYLAGNHYLDGPIKIIGNLFQLKFSGNYNIAFSLPLGGVYLNIAISALILILFCYLFFFIKKTNFREAYYLGFIILGAISNLADRLQNGFVVDYFDLKYFTVFNIADIMIVGGAGTLVGLNILGSKGKNGKEIL